MNFTILCSTSPVDANLSIKYGEDNRGGKFRDIMLKMFMQILANNAGCTKNNEQKKHTQKKKTQIAIGH